MGCWTQVSGHSEMGCWTQVSGHWTMAAGHGEWTLERWLLDTREWTLDMAAGHTVSDTRTMGCWHAISAAGEVGGRQVAQGGHGGWSAKGGEADAALQAWRADGVLPSARGGRGANPPETRLPPSPVCLLQAARVHPSPTCL
uniref:Uncharacterized protein n=1 Tax=Malurus cyaneus samueli TaxID=2593467 RepID=A0A8C5UG95_9PASS